MTAAQYDRKLQASIGITTFMGELAWHYTAEEMHRLWKALSMMVQRYGIVFVADAIGKSKAEAELALLRYGKGGSNEATG